ncbi:MAG: hemolysin family protein [Treponema sp.]|jgi:putative hemolysin|nr:hemolysin family protein [Treponema sp.]
MEESDPLLWQLLLQLALIACNAVFACAEIALLSVNTVKLEKLAAGGNRGAERLLNLTRKPAKFLAAIQVGITLAGFLGSAFAAENFSRKLSALLVQAGGTSAGPGPLPGEEAAQRLFTALPVELIHTISLVLITLILSFLTLVLGELVPKRIALRKAETLALALAPFITAVSALFAPAVWLLTAATNGLLRLFRINPQEEEKAVTEEEIRLLIDAGSERGSIASGEQEMIHNVFEFNDKTAGEVMTHRRDAALLWLKDGDEVWEKTVLETRYGYYPVCGDTVDDIRGVLSARDYLGLKDRSRAAALEKALRPAQFAPNTVGAHDLFRKMKARHSHFALVLDEYGSLDGIVTMNDLLEKLVGDLTEEENRREIPRIEKRGPGLWRFSGAVPLDKAARETGVSFPEGNDTFGGFVFTLLGRVPDDGEHCELVYAPPAVEGEEPPAKLRIAITEVKDRRLLSALVHRE